MLLRICIFLSTGFASLTASQELWWISPRPDQPCPLRRAGWSGVAPDGSILAVRDTSLEEIYSLELELP